MCQKNRRFYPCRVAIVLNLLEWVSRLALLCLLVLLLTTLDRLQENLKESLNVLDSLRSQLRGTSTK